jgi:hypothetical protein
MQTRPTFDLEDNAGRLADGSEEDGAAGLTSASRRRLLGDSLSERFGVEPLWAQGFKGGGVRMGVFDTGIKEEHPNIANIM